MAMIPAWCFKHILHIQILIISLAFLNFVLGIVKVSAGGGIRGRLDVWLIIVCIKSVIFMTYEILTTRSSKFQRWASTKANMILNWIEPVFWLTAVILCMMSLTRYCAGISCGAGSVYVIVAVILVLLTVCLAIVSTRERRAEKSDVKGTGNFATV